MPAPMPDRNPIPMPADLSLRGRLVGAWALHSYLETDVETGMQTHPMGPSPLGFILYTPDGYMSAQLQARDRALFSGADMYGGLPDEYAAAGKTYLAYSGRFFVDEPKGLVRHEMAVSLFPNWFGQVQARIVTLSGDRLTLRTEGPQMFHGAMKTAEVEWRRAAPNP